MKFDQTTASQCRYGDILGRVFGDWDILWEDSEADYQGHATILAKKGRRYAFYEYWYGSCSGCDGWESDGKGDDAIEKEMRESALYLDSKKELKDWLARLERPNEGKDTKSPLSNYGMERGGGLAAGLDILSGGLLKRINAIRSELGMTPMEGTDA